MVVMFGHGSGSVCKNSVKIQCFHFKVRFLLAIFEPGFQVNYQFIFY
mgnify:CR=1 FL=1